MNFKGLKMSTPLLSCRMHEHRFWEIVYQVDLPTNATVGGRDYRVAAGELIVIPPYTQHRTASDAPFRDISFQFDEFDFPPVPTVVGDGTGRIRALLDVMASLWEERSPENGRILERLLEAVLLCIRRASAAESEPRAVAEFKRTLLENVGNAYFDLGEAIRKTGYHPDYFRRCFKQVESLSPLGYLNRMRIERAKDLLQLEPSLSVGEIAQRCGFGDALYFSTAFRRAVGIAPLAYRKQCE